MKSKYLLLLKMQLYNFFGINRVLHSQSKKEKRRNITFGILAVLGGGLMITYSTLISIGLASLGAVNILPTLSALICSIVTLILTFLKSSGVIIGLRDYDMIMSLPVKKWEVVLSRITLIYLENFLINIIVALPSVVVFGLNTDASLVGNIIFLLSILFLPLIPMIISLGLGVLIASVSAKSRHRNIISLVLSTFTVLVIVAASAQIQGMSSDEFLNLGLLISHTTERIYPPAVLISKAVEHQSWIDFLGFAGISVFVCVLFVGIVAHFYQGMNTAAFSSPTVKYAGKALKVSSPLKAMYKREFSRYFSCTIYALNSTIGIILLFVSSIVLLFISPELLEQKSGIVGLSIMLRRILPLVVAVFITMTSTASAALSLEGKSRWIMCSAPVRTIDIFNSKIAVNLTVIAPFSLISIVLLGVKMEVSLIQAVFLCIVPTIYALFISVFGMYMNVKFPKYDWTSEYYAIKGGSISVLGTMSLGLLSSLIPLFLCITFQQFSSLIMIVVSACLILISLALYGKLKRYQLYAQ